MARQDLKRGGHRNGYDSYPNGNDSYSYNVEPSKKKFPFWLIRLFVGANIVMFIVVMYVNDCPKNNLGSGECSATFLGRLSFEASRENPLLGPSSSTLEKLGALEWHKVVRGHQGWRLFSCLWLHAGIIHLAANIFSSLSIGKRLERRFGYVRIGIIYLLSGFSGSILSSLFIRNRISVGATGPLFGLIGAMLSELLTNWSISTKKVGTFIGLTIVIAINVAVGLVRCVENFVHVGGFLTGFLLGFILLLRPQFGWIEKRYRPANGRFVPKNKIYQYVLSWVALILLIVGYIVGLVMLFKGKNGNDHCSWCHSLSCLPTSK